MIRSIQWLTFLDFDMWKSSRLFDALARAADGDAIRDDSINLVFRCADWFVVVYRRTKCDSKTSCPLSVF